MAPRKPSGCTFCCGIAVILDTFSSPMINLSLIVFCEVVFVPLWSLCLHTTTGCRSLLFSPIFILLGGCFFILYWWATVSRWSTLRRGRGWIYIRKVESLTGWAFHLLRFRQFRKINWINCSALNDIGLPGIFPVSNQNACVIIGFGAGFQPRSDSNMTGIIPTQHRHTIIKGHMCRPCP